ncbi:MAG TPA: FecR family protein, partial [Chitinophagaceae bacterium]|nr:FecR family protein [Chitinophagaceae bacterium]
MKNYHLYDVLDFVVDEDFIRWVNEKNPADETFWTNWLEQYPEKHLAIAEARQIVQTIRIETIPVKSAEIKKEVSRLLDTVRKKKPDQSSPVFWIRKWRLVAAIIILTGIAALTGIIINNWSSNRFTYVKATLAKRLVEQVNISDMELRIVLPDSSVVKLAPNSRLSYSNDMDKHPERDVYLSGEAFFEVTKNPAQPFRVFSDEVVTKVLGTSFTVRAFEKDKEIKVTVRTGKVRVYSQVNDEVKTEMNAEHPDDILLTPNQQVVYQRSKQKFQKTILEKPVIIDSAISKNSM